MRDQRIGCTVYPGWSPTTMNISEDGSLLIDTTADSWDEASSDKPNILAIKPL